MRTWKTTLGAKSLSGRQSKNTRPEVSLRKAIYRLGLRYRLHPKLGERLTADLLLLKYQLVVFVDGCWWHQCPKHMHWKPTGANARLWNDKFLRNRVRDERANMLAKSLGFKVVRVWECEIQDNLERAARKVIRALKPDPILRRRLK
jgi:DNA mismatch endonuclease (patch repair protein)